MDVEIRGARVELIPHAAPARGTVENRDVAVVERVGHPVAIPRIELQQDGARTRRRTGMDVNRLHLGHEPPDVGSDDHTTLRDRTLPLVELDEDAAAVALSDRVVGQW